MDASRPVKKAVVISINPIPTECDTVFISLGTVEDLTGDQKKEILLNHWIAFLLALNCIVMMEIMVFTQVTLAKQVAMTVVM